jgi:hypothetical protein
LSAKIASQYLLRLTLPCAQVAQAVLRNAHHRLRLKKQPIRFKDGNRKFALWVEFCQLTKSLEVWEPTRLRLNVVTTSLPPRSLAAAGEHN